MAAEAEQEQRRDGLERAAASVPALAGLVVGRVRDEAGGIWRDARAVAGRPAAEAGRPAAEAGLPEMSSSERVYFAWYGGLGLMAALRLIEWRLAAVIAAAHTIERYGRRERLRELAGGLGAGL
jgi:hypothetical protein